MMKKTLISIFFYVRPWPLALRGIFFLDQCDIALSSGREPAEFFKADRPIGRRAARPRGEFLS